MNIITNELKIRGYELKQSRVVNGRSNLNCIDVFKNGEFIRFISPCLDKAVTTEDGMSWSIKELFLEFYELTEEEFISKMINCSLEEYYAIKQKLKNLGFVRSELDTVNHEVDEEMKKNSECLSLGIDMVKLKNCWVVRGTNHITLEDCVQHYLFFSVRPDEKLFYEVLEMVKKIDIA